MYRISPFATALLAMALASIALAPSHAQEQFQFESPLQAKRRVFDTAGAGFRAIRRGPNGNYYILTAPAPALQIFDAAGRRVGQIPSDAGASAKGAALVYGESFDVDREGRVAVCDRGANIVRIYAANGSLATSIAIPGPVSAVLLPGGELATASPNTRHVVTVYDLAGKLVREYGDREEIADRADINNQVNFGYLTSDEIGNTYFAFYYLPEPTMRKFDLLGYLSMEISLKTLEFQPAAQSARRAIARSERGTPSLQRIINAIGVDPKTQDVWLAIGTLLMHFDRDGRRLASFRTYMPGGARIEASAILVEPDRLLIGADPHGIYEFPKPDKLP
jgi:hypothetical protein